MAFHRMETKLRWKNVIKVVNKFNIERNEKFLQLSDICGDKTNY